MAAHEAAAGGMVYCYDAAGQPLVALILDKYDNWGMPKGHLEAGENEVEAAQREVAEETGLRDCALGPLIARIAYDVHKGGKKRHKTVAYFLARSPHVPLQPQLDEGIRQARWFTPDEALAHLAFEQVRDVLRQGLAMLAASGEQG
jgi:8-oxo-dGTP pyrophosphatase MutT (NUDIX family)